MTAAQYRLFLVAPPGLEHIVLAEAQDHGFANPTPLRGGVEVSGTLPDLWHASLALRTPARILLRVGEFRAMHLAQLHKRARKLDWAALLRPDVPVMVEATCHKSRIYHAKAAAQRVARAIDETLGVPVADDAPLKIKIRIDDDLCTISLDTTGNALHLRGHKAKMGKAPLRENLAAACLRACGFTGGTLVDPMCGSGTFVHEAAEIAHHLQPGRDRGFGFEHMAGFDAAAFAALRRPANIAPGSPIEFFGYDRDQGAVRSARDNAALAGVGDVTQFECAPISELQPPTGATPGLIMINPPYGARIGNRKQLFGLYGVMGQIMQDRFAGWRFGMITSDPGLAKATGLQFTGISQPFSNGGLKIALYQAQL